MVKKVNSLAGFINKEELDAVETEYPLFNNCDHHTIDMRHVKAHTEEWMNTISVILPNNKSVTLCFMALNENELNIDAKLYGYDRTKILGFSGAKTEVMKDMNIYAITGKVE